MRISDWSSDVCSSDLRTFQFSNDKLHVEFDAIYSAEDVGAYKPADANFDYMKAHLADLGLKPEDVLHTAESLFHDHVPARRHGFANCWIYRRHAQEGFGATMVPGELPPYDFRSEEHTSELQSLMRISY